MHGCISQTVHRHQTHRVKCYKWPLLLQACVLLFVWFLSREIIKMNTYLLLNNSLMIFYGSVPLLITLFLGYLI